MNIIERSRTITKLFDGYREEETKMYNTSAIVYQAFQKVIDELEYLIEE